MNTAYPHPCRPRRQPPLDLHGVLTYREHGASERASGGPPEGSAKDDRVLTGALSADDAVIENADLNPEVGRHVDVVIGVVTSCAVVLVG